MIQIRLPALPDSLSFASRPKNMLHSFLDWWRQAFLLVLLHPTRVDCVNCSFESPSAFLLSGCYNITDAVSFVRFQKYAEKIFGPRCSTAAGHPRCCPGLHP